MIRGCELVDRYGPEIEYDLHHELNLDMCDWFSGREAPPWGKLIRMVDQLPTHSRFKAALLDDDEFAESIGVEEDDDDDEKKNSRKPGLAGYDPVVARLTDIGDLLISLRSTLVAVNSEKGKEPKGVKYLPRPETAFDRLKRRERHQNLNHLTSILVPGQ